MENTKYSEEVKARSERIILEKGGKILDWLPVIERNAGVRSNDELINRALILNALVNIYFQAPIPIIRDWLQDHDLLPFITEDEKKLLGKKNEDLKKQDLINILWYNEALWALMWAGNLIDDIPIDAPVEDYMADLCPNLEQGEDDRKFRKKMKMRSLKELYSELDLYYRSHWYTEDGRINNYPTGKIDGGVIMERRKALEWLLDKTSDWDNISMNT